MRHSRLFLLFCLAFSVWFAGCAPKVRTTLENSTTSLAKPATQNVVVFEQGQPRPADAQLLGFSRISDNGFSFNCSYPEVLELARQETRKAGGNALQILEHTKPDLWSTCHRIEVAMLFSKSLVHDVDDFIRKTKLRYDSLAAYKEADSVFAFTEIRPEFPGGDAAFMAYLTSSVKYPKAAMKQNVSGKSIMSFVISETGYVEDIKVLQSVSPEIDEEMKRVLSGMPRWTPGFQNGKAVKVVYTIPTNFDINDSRPGK